MITPDSPETVELLARAQQGDRDASEKLFSRHRDDLQRVLQLRMEARLRSRLDVSDVLQEAQLEACRRLPDYLARRPMPFRLWLRRTACERLVKLRRDHVETGRRSVELEKPLPDRSSMVLAEQFLARSSSPSRHLHRKEVIQRVQIAVAQLEDADREILLMRNVEKLPYSEIGCLLSIESAAARKRYGRALLRLAALLRDAGISGA